MMKNTILILLFILAAGYAPAQISVTLGSALQQTPGTDIHLPVTVTGLNSAAGGTGVTAIEIHIHYPETQLTYDTTINFASLLPSSQWFFGGNGAEYSTNWLEPNGNPLNIPDQTRLFEVVFHYNGGVANLVFDTARCILVDSSYNIIAGVHYINGQITPSAGNDESRWNGTGTWNTAGNWSNGIPGDSTHAVIESGQVTLMAAAVCQSMNIHQGSAVVIAPLSSLTVNRDFLNEGSLELMADASGTGSLIVQGLVTGSGSNQFHCYLDPISHGSYQVASPVAGATASVFGDYPVDRYAENSQSWGPLAGSEMLEQGAGYEIHGTHEATIGFEGLFPTGNVVRENLSYTGSGAVASRGLNLVGNPYPSAIRWDGNQDNPGIDASIYVWNGYQYLTWNGTVGSLSDGIIPAMQGFFVKTGVTGASLTVPATSRLHRTSTLLKSTVANSSLLSLSIQTTADTLHVDRSFVWINSGSTADFDAAWDAWKLTGDEQYPQLWTATAGQSNLSIDTRPGYEDIAVVVKTAAAGYHKIDFSGIESFSPSQPLFFEDAATQTVINLRSSESYVFLSAGGTETGRFILHFKEVGIEDHPGMDSRIWYADRVVHLEPTAGFGLLNHVTISNVQGAIFYETSHLELPAKICTDRFPVGLYVLKAEGPGGVSVKKILIH